jgi:hypothetical protein
MAVQKAMTTGTNGVMDWFDRNATSPYYSVCEIISPTKKELLFSCNEDSVDNARRILEENISAFEQNGVNTLYALILHPKKDKTGYITMNTPSHAMLKFRPAELEQPIYGVGAYTGGNGGSNRYEMEKIMEKLNLLESKLAESELEDEVDETPQSPINAMLNNMASNPQVQEALISGLLGVVGGFLNNGKQMTGVAGFNLSQTNPADITDEAIMILDSLIKKGVSIDHLRKLDAMSNTKLQSLLIML